MDTAQPAMAAETDRNSQIADAADAFKAYTSGEPVERPRDEQGRFAAVEPAEEVEIAEAEPVEGEAEASDDDGQEAAEPAQPMPPSWPADQSEQWSQLPAETQAFLANREAERERAVQGKFQESANARKAAEAAQAEAQSSLEQYASALDLLEGLLNPVKPDPRAFGYGTQQYNRDAFDAAQFQYEQEVAALAQVKDQRAALTNQQAQAEAAAFKAWKDSHEAEYAPKLLADVPELTDSAKALPLVNSLVSYAIQNGIPEQLFAPEVQDQITSAQLHLIWKASKYDELRASPAQAKPKPAVPAVRPGVSSPRSAQKQAALGRDLDRLNREGSVEAGAAVFKHFLKR